MSTNSPNTTLLQAKDEFSSDKTPAEITGPSNKVTFTERGVTPPSFLYIERDDVLAVEAMSLDTAEVVTVNYRLLLADGSIVVGQDSLALTLGATATNAKQLNLAEGYLLSLGISCANATQRGQCYVRVFVNRGNFTKFTPNAARILVADYVARFAPTAWPDGRQLYSTEGPGRIYRVQNAAPGAGIEFTVVVPLGIRWKVLSVFATLTTSATVANRQVQIQYRNNATAIFAEVNANANIPATTVANITGAMAEPYNTLITTSVQIPLPMDMILEGTDQIHSNTINLQAGDVWSNQFVAVEEWIEGGAQ